MEGVVADLSRISQFGEARSSGIDCAFAQAVLLRQLRREGVVLRIGDRDEAGIFVAHTPRGVAVLAV